METTVVNKFEEILDKLLKGLSVRGIQGHEKTLEDAKKEFFKYFEEGRKEIILHIKDKKAPFGIKLLVGKELEGIVTVTERSFTTTHTSNQKSFALTKEHVKDHIVYPQLVEAFLLEEKHDAIHFFTTLFKSISDH